jgi:FkbM family methyltransferase
MQLRNLLGTDIKESIKKVLVRFRNRNFKPYVVDRTLYQTDFKFYVGDKDGESWYVDSSADILREHKEWLWLEMEFVKNFICKEGDIVLECGGHHGLTAVVISKWIGPQGYLYSFEPNPKNQIIMHKNLEINSIKNVEIVPNAIGSEAGKIMVSYSNSNSYVLKKKEHNGIEVPVVTADDFINRKPTVIKIDVEGFETEVLKGAQNLLKTLPKLIIELHPDMMLRYGNSVNDLLLLIDERYKLWVQRDINKAPEPYDRKTPITQRAHLFAIP